MAFSTRPVAPVAAPELVDDERRDLDARAVGVRLPAHDPDTRARSDALVAEDLAQRPRPVARLARQTQVLEQDTAHRQRRRAGRPPALVPDQDRRVAARPDDRDGLLEARVEPAQPREIGAVLAVGVDDEAVVAVGLHRRAEAVESCRVHRGRDERLQFRHPEIGQFDVSEASGAGRSVSSHGAGGDHSRISPDARSTIANWSAEARCQGPTVPSGHVTRTSADDAGPRPKCCQPSSPPAWPPPTVTSRRMIALADPDLDPRADGVHVRRRLGRPDVQPVGCGR